MTFVTLDVKTVVCEQRQAFTNTVLSKPFYKSKPKNLSDKFFDFKKCHITLGWGCVRKVHKKCRVFFEWTLMPSSDTRFQIEYIGLSQPK